MSRAAVIDYEAIGLETQAVCNLANNEVLKIDSLIENINKGATNIINDRIVNYQKELMKEKQILIEAIDAIQKDAELLKQKGTVKSDTDYDEYKKRNELVEKATTLKAKVDSLATNKILVIEELINEELINIGNLAKDKLIRESYGQVDIKADILEKINQLPDLVVRESALLLLRESENKELDFLELVKKAEERLERLTEELKTKNKVRIINQIKEDMVKAKVDNEIIEKTIGSTDNIDLIKQNATKEIINEEIRLESLKIILKTIRDRGFIVDTKKNIKINRESNEVILVAQKATGEVAEFKIYLDGKFIYHFDGYEGQACQEDLQPFLEDLENIYGFEMEEQSVIWSNPDKISTQKYQAIDTKKGKR